MADATLGSVLRHARQMAGAANLSDGELLHAFLSRQDQDAFAALTRRHGPMVWGVCRRVLRHQQDAEDAFQATFLVLARKAASVRDRPALASWLYGAAYRTALTLKRSEARRRSHEERVRPLDAANPVNELTWREVEALLEEEIQRLPEKYRTVFVLCCLEGQGRAEVARRLGLKEGTLSSRLDQARKQLQRRLARRGVTLSAVLAAVALTQAAVPPALLAETARAATALAAGKGLAAGLVSAKVVAVFEEALQSMAAVRLKAVLALALTLGAIAGWAGLSARPGPAGNRVNQPAPADQPRPAAVLHPGKDLHGDPLPPGALARLGTVRFRHGSTVTGLAYAPDGKSLVSGSYDGTLRVWETATGRELLRLRPFNGSVYDISLSADGKTVAAVDFSTLYLGDLKTGRLTQPTLPRVQFRASVALSPDGKIVAALPADDTVGLWETASGKPLRECRGHKGKVKRVAFAPDGKSLASCGEDGTVRLWDVQSGKETLRLTRKQAVGAVAFSGDGQFLAAGGADGKLCLWQLPAGKLLHELGGAPLAIETVAFSPDCKTVAASGNGNMIYLWDVTTGKRLRRLEANPTAIAFAPDGRTLAAGGHDCTIRLWDVATGKERTPPAAGHSSSIISVAVARDGTVVTCGWDRLIRLWEAASGKELRQLKATTPFSPHMALSPDGKIVASNYCLWDRASGKELGRFNGQDSSIEVMAFSPDGRTLAMASQAGGPRKDRPIRLWDVATLKVQKQFSTQPVHALSYAPDGKILAAGNADGTVRLWNVATGREVRSIKGHPREVNSVAFSPDGKALASSSFDGSLFLWDAATGKPLRPLVRSTDPRFRAPHILAVAFAPNGKMLASAEYGLTPSITLWEVATGQVRVQLVGHQGSVNALAFAPDSRALVSGSFDTSALVWDVMGPRRPAPAGGLAASWDDLLAADAARAYRAIGTLARSPDVARFLGQRLSPAPMPDRRGVDQLIKDLDSDVFADREKASQELEKRGEEVESALRKALLERPALEARLRLERLLGKLDAQWLRTQRALEALELAGTPAARKVLEALAGGAPEARRTREAKAALERWAPSRAAVP